MNNQIAIHGGLAQELATAANALPTTLTCLEAANFARVCTRTVRRWIRSGRLNAAKTNPGKHGRILILRDSLVRLLAGGL